MQRPRGPGWRWRQLALLLLLVPVMALAGLPETPRFRQLGVVDGLPSNRINAITEDHHGYLWIGTSDGLARFDGIGYRIWRREQGLRDNYVWAVHVDAQDRLWVGTLGAGLAMLDRARGTWRYYDTRNSPVMLSNGVWTVTSTPDGTVWFGTDGAGLYRLAADGTMTRFIPEPGNPRSLPDLNVTNVDVAPDGTLWVTTINGVARWVAGKDGAGEFARVPADALPDANIDGLSIESDNTVWFGSAGGVAVRTPNGAYSAAPMTVYGSTAVYRVLAHDRSGVYWLDIPDGLGRIDEGGIVNVPLYSAAAQGIVKPSWSSGHEDRSGGLWLASDVHGVWYLPPNWRMFSVLARNTTDPASMTNAHVKGIAPSADGTMWLVGSGGMLDRLNPETGAIEHVVPDIGAGRVPVSVLEDSRGAVWVGYLGGLARFTPSTGAVQRWAHDGNADAALEFNTVNLLEGGGGTVWASNAAGDIQVRDPDGRVRLSMSNGEGAIARVGPIDQLVRGPDGSVWVASEHGLWAWNDGARRFEPVPGAMAARTNGVALAGDDTVWVTRTGVVERYGWDGARLTLQDILGPADGMLLVAPSGLSVDASGIVWVTSVRGLMRVDPGKRQVRVYGVQDGLPSQEFGARPVSRPADGRILVGSPDGLVIFDPAVVRPSTVVPRLVVEGVSVHRGDQHVEFSADRPFSVEHDDRDLHIVARLLSFAASQSNRYRFKLDGYDDAWVESGAEGERVFSTLPAGDYRLQIKGRTADNVWSKVTVLHFRVAAPWWRTGLAIAAWILLLALVVDWLLHAYRERLRRRNAFHLSQHKHEIAEQASLAKTRFLATLGHEVRTPMTGVLGMSELLLATALDTKQRGYIESIRRAGNHLMRLVNDALDLARIEAGKLELDPQAFDLHAMIDDVTGLMAPMAQQRGLVFHSEVASDLPRWLRGDAVRVRQILLNLLGNAIKFTEHGEVGLLAEPMTDGVRLIVSDTGPGLNDEQRQRLFRRFEQAEGARTASRYGGSGLGLAICQELAAAMAGRIDVDSLPGAGTCFTVELPLIEVAAPSELPAMAPMASSAPTRALQLLLVEDDPIVAEVVVGLLQAQGHRVVHVAHGLAALVETATTTFDLALLDLDLPGIDGLALARQLRTGGFAQPLLAVTARSDADAEPLACAAGFDGFLRKPLTGGMLVDAIEALLPERAARAAMADVEQTPRMTPRSVTG
ncbi:MAG: ATP-binding protein [Luteimonas sp.]